MKKIIVTELEDVRKKYAEPRRTGIVYGHEVEEYTEETTVDDYAVSVFLSREGYFQEDHARLAAHERGSRSIRRATRSRRALRPPTPPR